MNKIYCIILGIIRIYCVSFFYYLQCGNENEKKYLKKPNTIT